MVNPVRLASLLALAAFPLLEIGVMIRAGQVLGFWRLALIVVLTAILGSFALRRVGIEVVTKARAGIEAGRGGIEPLFDGLLQVTAGVLLILPGLISDLMGGILLVPPIRKMLSQRILPRMVQTTRDDVQADDRFQRRPKDSEREQRSGNGVVIEGEYERIDEKTVPPEAPAKRRASS